MENILFNEIHNVGVHRFINDALQKTSLKKTDRAKLLSDNGSCYISTELGSYLERAGRRHVRGRVRHPQTQGKIERYHESLKNLTPADVFFCKEDQIRNQRRET